MEGTLLIFVPKLTARITYTFSLFFDSILILPYRIIQSEEEYKTYNGPKLCYADKPVDANGLFFCWHGLLIETGIKQQSITVSEWNGMKIFYQVNGSALPFDIFAASFYLVSRYEEYLTPGRDMHKRFRVEDSLAFKNHFVDKPLVNLWAAEFKKILLAKYPQLSIKENPFKFIPTVDIDVAFAHLGRNLKIIIGSYLLALAKFNLPVLADKTLTLLRLKKDKYNTYDYQESIFKRYNVRPIYFFLASRRGRFDKNVPTTTKRFANLVKRVRKFADVGIHPSYQSASKMGIVAEEKVRVEKHLQAPITKSRQHFLRISLPETYRCLAELKITDDYSLAHAARPGFRASICTPFFFYDLQKEETLPVKVHPTVVMDGTLREYMQLKPEDAITLSRKLIEEVKICGGEFVCIWHNHSLGETSSWRGWTKVFEAMLENGLSVKA